MLDFNNTLTIVRTCVNGGRPDLIEDALFERLSVSDLRAKIEAERPAAPSPAAKPSPAKPAASRSILGDEPSPEQADALAAALARRFVSQAGSVTTRPLGSHQLPRCRRVMG